MPPARKNKAVVNGVKKTKKEEDRSTPVPDDVPEDESPAAEEPPVKKAKKRPAKPAKREVKPSVDRGGDRRAVKAPQRYEAPVVAPTSSKRPKTSGGGGQFPVQAIRGIRQTGKKLEFYVKWEGYPETSNNWEPESNVRSCSEHIKKFLDEVTRTTNNYA